MLVYAKHRSDFHKFTWMSAGWLADFYNEMQHARDHSDAAIEQYNRHIAHCNRAIEAELDGTWKSQQINEEITEWKQKVEELARLLDESTAERKKLAITLSERERTIADLSVRIEDLDQRIKGKPFTISGQPLTVNESNKVMVNRINMLERQLREEQSKTQSRERTCLGSSGCTLPQQSQHDNEPSPLTRGTPRLLRQGVGSPTILPVGFGTHKTWGPEMLVTIKSFGSLWTRRIGHDPDDPKRFTRAAYYNTTGIRVGEQLRHRWRVGGDLRFYGNRLWLQPKSSRPSNQPNLRMLQLRSLARTQPRRCKATREDFSQAGLLPDRHHRRANRRDRHKR